MRLILRKDVDNLGEVGDVVEVADGYGLNYLIPQGIALHATASTVRATRHEQRLREAQIESARRTAQDYAGEFTGVALEFSMRAGEDGRLFGSVTNRMIEEALQERGLAVNRRKIVLEEPIKQVGDYEVAVRLHQDVRVSVQVQVTPDAASIPAEADEESEASGEAEAGVEAGAPAEDAVEASAEAGAPAEEEAEDHTGDEAGEDVSGAAEDAASEDGADEDEAQRAE